MPALHHSKPARSRGDHHDWSVVLAFRNAWRLSLVPSHLADDSGGAGGGEPGVLAGADGRAHRSADQRRATRRPSSCGATRFTGSTRANAGTGQVKRMAYSPRRSSGLFSGLVLIIVGVLLLLHEYRGFELIRLFTHWWPLLIIALGLIKLYERTAGSRYVEPGAARITGGEIFVLVAVLAIVGVVIAVEEGEKHFSDHFGFDMGNSYPFDLDAEPRKVPEDARITIRGTRGDITVRPGDGPEIRVSGKANIHTWNERDAEKLRQPTSVQITQNGDGYEVFPTGEKDDRISVDMDVTVPPRSGVTVRNDKGDVSVSDLSEPVTINNGNGDVDVRDSGDDVNITSHKGDLRVSDTKGNVKLEGHGGQVDVIGATGGLTLSGEFYGPIRAEKIAKGVRFISQRTDLLLTQLSGHMEFSSGNLEIADAPGNLTFRTSKHDIDIENAGGKDDVQITNSNLTISLSLPSSASFVIVADCHSCDISSDFAGGTLEQTSNSGDAHLQGKFGSGRGPKIVLKTSYGSISLHKTSTAEPAPAAKPAPPAPPATPPANPRKPTPAPKAAPSAAPTSDSQT